MTDHEGRIRGAGGRLMVLACAGLFLATPVQARQLADLARPTKTSNVPDRPAQSSPVSNVSLAAMRAELAWWADPTVFPCDIQIVPRGRGLEARGFVPTAEARDRALEVARQASGFEVADALQVIAGRAKPKSDPLPEGLHRTAISAVVRALPGHVYDVTVETWGNGQVVLKGKVDNYQEKMIASRCLRRVPGCACVLNQLSVAGEALGPALLAGQEAWSKPDKSGLSTGQAQTEVAAAQFTSGDRISKQTGTRKPAAQTPADATATADVVYTGPSSEGWLRTKVNRMRHAVSRVLWGPGHTSQTAGEGQAGVATSQTEVSLPLDGRKVLALNDRPAKSVPTSSEVVQVPSRVSSAPANTVIEDAPISLDSPRVVQSGSVGPAGSIHPDQMRDYIAGSCSRPVHGLDVALATDGTLDIQLRADSPHDAELISNQIMLLPELKRYRVSLTVNTSTPSQ
jgi:hypothetical protein